MSFLPRRADAGGSAIDRTRPLNFTFNGAPLQGFVGDSLASALLANSLTAINGAPKSGGPRGMIGCRGDEADGRVQLSINSSDFRDHAGLVELHDGLEAASARPVGGGGLFARKPKTPEIELPADRLTRDVPTIRHLFCDVLVVGSGPTGIGATLAAGQTGARVVLADSDWRLGGSMLGMGGTFDGLSPPDWADASLGALKAMNEVRLMPRTTVLDFAGGQATLLQRRDDLLGEQVFQLNLKEIVLATGAHEQPLVFPRNDTPGVMLASAAQNFAVRYGLVLGDHPILVTNNDTGYAAACALFDSGTPVRAVIDYRREFPAPLVAPLVDRGIDLIGGHCITDVLGRGCLDGIEIGRLDGDGLTGKHQLDCDLLLMAGGWQPEFELALRSGAQAEFTEDEHCWTIAQGEMQARIAGGAALAGNALACLRDGFEKGSEAAVAAEYRKPSDADIPDLLRDFPETPPHAMTHVPVIGGWTAKRPQVVDFSTGATVADGAPDRPAKVPFSQIGDLRLEVTTLPPPLRRLPTDLWAGPPAPAWAKQFDWRIPRRYGDGPAAETVTREIMSVRHAAGLYDASHMGKFAINGPDALAFLNKITLNDIAAMAPGEVRHVLFLEEDGSLRDEAVLACFASDEFWLTVRPEAESKMAGWLDKWAAEWTHLQLFVTRLSGQWGCLMLAGPRARHAFVGLESTIDTSIGALGHMRAAEGRIAGYPARLLRTGATGNVTFEVFMPSGLIADLWQQLLLEGTSINLAPIGADAMEMLRLEKGFLDFEVDIDPETTPFEIAWPTDPISKQESFVGKTSLASRREAIAQRAHFVGLTPQIPDTVLPPNGIIFGAAGDETPQGRIIRSFHSPSLKRDVTFAMVRNGTKRLAEDVIVRAGGTDIPAKISRPPLFDPHGARMHD